MGGHNKGKHFNLSEESLRIVKVQPTCELLFALSLPVSLLSGEMGMISASSSSCYYTEVCMMQCAEIGRIP